VARENALESLVGGLLKLKVRTAILSLLLASSAFPHKAAVTVAQMKIYIEPDKGFESFVAGALVKKDVPVIVTLNKQDADFILTSAVVSERETTGGKIARCAFMYCIGVDGYQVATVQLLNARGEVTWAYNVRKGNVINYQSSAESVAKHLKQYLEDQQAKSLRESRKSRRKSDPA
jgi:hypothetical protein